MPLPTPHYDVTRRETFDAVAGWLGRAREATGVETIYVLVGNKAWFALSLLEPEGASSEWSRR